jgi:hypothetical protein
LSEIGHSLSPPCPLPRGVVHCPRSDSSHHPPVLYREGWFFVQNWTFLLTPLVLYKEGRSFVRDRLLSSSPPCPLPRGVVHCPRSDFPHHPLSSTERGGPLSEIGLFSSPPCPLSRGVVLCPKLDFYPHPLGPLPRGEILCPRSDFPHHPPVLYREGWSIVRDRTFLITPLSSTERGGLLSEIGLLSSPPWSSTKRGDPLFEIELSSSPPCPLPRGVVHCPRSDFPHHPLSSTERGGLCLRSDFLRGYYSSPDFLTRLLLLFL